MEPAPRSSDNYREPLTTIRREELSLSASNFSPGSGGAEAGLRSALQVLITKKRYEYGLFSMSINETIFAADFGVLGSWRANHTGTPKRHGLE
ncbi:hypothetical protein MKX08_006318 [Trichoderma sp. CBMAI-0020]|nr:hypothetical protein MKX08_006318 [Trichoderma sp. CBMAI-0020]